MNSGDRLIHLINWNTNLCTIVYNRVYFYHFTLESDACCRFVRENAEEKKWRKLFGARGKYVPYTISRL
jgi:hypothetical protein